MKQKKFNKLAINKSTVADLNNKEMQTAKGGLQTIADTCNTRDDCTRPMYCPTYNMRVCRTDQYWC